MEIRPRKHFLLPLSLTAVILTVILAYAIAEQPAINTTPRVNDSRHNDIEHGSFGNACLS